MAILNSLHKNKPAELVVGISGGSGAGKTTITLMLAELLAESDAGVIELDYYYRPLARGRRAEEHNFDHPNALDMALLKRHLAAVKRGREIRLPRYDFKTHQRLDEPRPFPCRRIVLVEGSLLFADARLRDLFDLRLYVDAPPDVRLHRRLTRDVRERGRTYDSVIRQYVATVRPMHLKFIEPHRDKADIVLMNDGTLERVRRELKGIGERIDNLLARARKQ